MTQIKNEILTKDNDINILALFHFFLDERKKITLIILISFLIGILYAFIATPWYEATVKILPPNNGSPALNQYSGIASIFGINLGTLNDNRQDLYPEIIKSNFILSRVLNHKFRTQAFSKPVTLFEFWQTEFDSSRSNFKHILYEKKKRILKNEYISCRIDKATNILYLTTIVPRDPILAAELANFIVEQLDYFNKYLRKYKAREQRQFIEKGVKDTEKNLKISQENLKKFREANRNISFSPEKQLELESIQTELEVQKAIYIELKKQLEIAKIEEIKETETLDILESAEVPIKRKKPKRFIIILVTTLSGIIISLIIFTIFYLIKYKNISISIAS